MFRHSFFDMELGRKKQNKEARIKMMINKPSIYYGLLSVTFWNELIFSTVLKISKTMQGLCDTIDTLYKQYYKVNRKRFDRVNHEYVLLFHVKVGNPTLLTYDILRTMPAGMANSITIVRDHKPLTLARNNYLRTRLCAVSPFYKFVFEKESEYRQLVKKRSIKDLKLIYTRVTGHIPKWYYTKLGLRRGIHDIFKNEISNYSVDILDGELF